MTPCRAPVRLVLAACILGAWVLVLSLAGAVPSAAQSGGWVRTEGGCQVWNPWEPAPPPGGALGWSGGCVGGKASGQGRLTRRGEKERVFDGTLRDGVAHGQGSIGFADGSFYIGQWQDGRRFGQGIQTLANGNRYQGEWRADVPHGRGTLTSRDGMRYEGDWKDGQRTGQGTFTMRDGSRYTGGFLNGRPDGQGTQVFANGSRYEGMWKHGLPNGPGTGYGAGNGRVFKGSFVNGCVRTPEYSAAFGVPEAECR